MTFGQMDEQKERQTNRRRDRQTGGETDEQKERQTNRDGQCDSYIIPQNSV